MRAKQWPAEAICLDCTDRSATDTALTGLVYARTCRTGFDQPGFCVISVPEVSDSREFRRTMVQLQRAMSDIHEANCGERLAYVSASRFDQQETTRPHLDGGPPQSFLMLGYEPSLVESEIQITDLARCSADLGLTPEEFLIQHNPMFRDSDDLLAKYTTNIACFTADSYQIVCINNSKTHYDPTARLWQGTLHTARILTPNDSHRRIINSTMIAPESEIDAAPLDEGQINDFLTTSKVRRRGYDKQHLRDDD